MPSCPGGIRTAAGPPRRLIPPSPLENPASPIHDLLRLTAQIVSAHVAPAVVQRPEGESVILAVRAKLIRDLAARPDIMPEDADSSIAATLRDDLILKAM